MELNKTVNFGAHLSYAPAVKKALKLTRVAEAAAQHNFQKATENINKDACVEIVDFVFHGPKKHGKIVLEFFENTDKLLDLFRTPKGKITLSFDKTNASQARLTKDAALFKVIKSYLKTMDKLKDFDFSFDIGKIK